MPVLARTLEAAGLATILVTNMPFWAERIGVPRTLAVEFPFGHTLGQPNDSTQQMRVIRQALAVLSAAITPGEIVHSLERWPVPAKDALLSWQPETPSPVIQIMAPKIRELLRQRRQGGQRRNCDPTRTSTRESDKAG